MALARKYEEQEFIAWDEGDTTSCMCSIKIVDVKANVIGFCSLSLSLAIDGHRTGRTAEARDIETGIKMAASRERRRVYNQSKWERKRDAGQPNVDKSPAASKGGRENGQKRKGKKKQIEKRTASSLFLIPTVRVCVHVYLMLVYTLEMF